ncbi:hypothetical protein MTP03_34800 [Tsukamurella sp. PLM1]|nr:hypothetical protein MTP03_34800 [Tsukamurella sp. PLM1]
MPALSASAPFTADASDWPRIKPLPRIVMTVAERPSGLRSAPRLNSVTSVGPTPMPAIARPAMSTGRDGAAAIRTAPNTSTVAKLTHRAAMLNRSGSSAEPRARAAEPTPMTP